MSDDFEKARHEAANAGPMGDLTELASMAVQGNEIHAEYMKAGFSSPQALYLLGCILTGNPGNPPKG